MKLQTHLSLVLVLVFTVTVSVTESSQPPFSCGPSTKPFPFCRSSLPVALRARDLVSRLTLPQKISQLVTSSPPLPSLGVPPYEWWSEALHGVSDVGPGVHLNGTAVNSATSFPQVILSAASFSPRLWFRIARAAGVEARAVYNAGQAQGLTFWAPNINIFRDPRWGRGQETPGEDPILAAKYSVAFVRGLQGDSFQGGNPPAHLLASACCKHFTAYDLDSWNGVTRFVFNAKVSAQDLADTYQPPFRSCVQQGKASGIMCAYNRVNGVPSCADYNLLTNTARRQWGFRGYITSDCDAVSIIHDAQGYAKSPEDAVADVLRAGMDVNCGTYLREHTESAIQQKKLRESDIDRALHNLFSVRMRLGLFDGNPANHLFGNIGPNQACSPEHQLLALEAAEDGIVLLKNSARLLPLPKSTRSLAVIGPNANNAFLLLGNYAGRPCKSVEVLQALKRYVKNTVYHQGCDSVACSSASIDDSVNMARGAEHVVLVMGLDQTQEREGHDRLHLELPGMQRELITKVAAAAKKPVVLVLICGGPVDVTFAKYDRNIGSILWAGYPGEAGGIALAEIIFGDHNPGGRLPVTWYPKEYANIPMTDMRMRPAAGYPGRTYRFYQGKKVYEFGYGLSYTKYTYEFTPAPKNILYLNESSTTRLLENPDSARYKLVSELSTEFCDSKKFKVTVGVKNEGDMAGKHPILMFWRQEKPRNGSPLKQLVAFESVILSAGERAEIGFEMSPCEHLSTAEEDGLMIVEEGTHFLVIGEAEYPISVVV